MSTVTVAGLDTVSIHAARDAAGAGGTVLFPAGAYTVDGLTAAVQDQTWQLERYAKLQRSATSPSPVLNLTASGLRLRGGTLDGARGINPNVADAIDSTGCSLDIEDVTIQNVPGWGVAIDNAALRMVRCSTVNTYKAPVIWRTTTTGVRQGPVISHCVFDREAESSTGIQSGGILVQALNPNNIQYLIEPRITDNLIKLPWPSSSYAAVGIEVSAAQHVHLSGNKITGGRIGYSFGSVSFGIMLGNFGAGQRDYFIELVASGDCNIQGNNASGYAAPSSFGLRVSGGSSSILLLGNKLRGFDTNISVTPDCSGVTDAYNG